jgi:hypothetical protein
MDDRVSGELLQRLESSFFTTGIDPGFCQDLIPMTLMGLTGRVDRLRIQEILDYSTYPNPRILFDIMGFGRPVDDRGSSSST